MKRMLRSLLVLGVLGLSGCGDGPTGPEHAPPPPPVPEPQLQLIPFLFACNTFQPPVDPDALVLADLFYFGPEAEAGIQKAGGRVVHRYNLSILRAEIRAGSIPTLPDISQARGVTDAGKKEAEVIISYDRAVGEADIQQLRALGATGIYRLGTFDTVIVAILPDASVPTVQRLEGVKGITINSVVCLFDRG